MQYVVKKNGKLVGSNGRLVSHFNDAELYPSREMARFAKDDVGGDKIYRVRVKPVVGSFEKVR